MFDFNSLREAYQKLDSVAPADRGQYVTEFVWTAIAFSVYYIVVGVVVIVLGRRLIQASFAAFKEARRERP